MQIARNPILSREYGCGIRTPKFSWTHRIEPGANYVRIQAIIEKPHQIGSVLVGGVQAKFLGALDDPITNWRVEDWELFDPPQGTRVLQVAIKGDDVFSNCQTASTTIADAIWSKSEVVFSEEEQPLPPDTIRIPWDWIKMRYEERRLPGVTTTRGIELRRSTITATASEGVVVYSRLVRLRKKISKVKEVLKIARLIEAYDAWRASEDSE